MFQQTHIWRVALLAVLTMTSGCLDGGASEPNPSPSPKEPSMENPDQSDLGTVLQLVIDQEDLERYYHVEELPDRKPLRVLPNAALGGTPELSKFGVPVVYEDEGAAAREGRAAMEFRRVVVDPHLAYVEFAYDAEGVVGEAWLIKEDGRWRMGPFTVAER